LGKVTGAALSAAAKEIAAEKALFESVSY